MDNGFTIINLLKRASTLFPDKKVIGNVPLTYSKMYSSVRKIAASFIKMGMGNGKAIAVADFNSIEFMELLFASSMAGSIIYPVNIKLPAAISINTIKESGAEYLFASDVFLKAGMGKGFKNDNIISMSDTDGYVPFKEFLKSDMFPEGGACSEDEYSILFTSGTTGSPKELLYTETQAFSGAMSILYQLGLFNSPASLNHSDKILSLIPFYHIWAWGSPFHAAFLGSDYILSGRYDALNILNLIEENGVTWLNAVPTMAYDLISNDSQGILNGIKMLIGGSPVNRGLATKLLDRNIKFSTIYGGTDMLAASISLANHDIVDYDYIRTTTHPVPTVNISIKDSSGRVLGPGKMGEIFVNSPWLPGKYINRKSSPEYRDGWLQTGDVGIMDKYGGLQILDRTGDIIKSGGEWIPSSVIESIISEVPGVLNNAVIGVQDEKWGERPIAYIQGNRDLEIQIKGHLKEYEADGKINKWWIPSQFRFIQEIPLTSTGKNDKKSLRELAK
ncbi:MAG: AMP-binding protein [Ferroplasma sp.]